MKYLTLLIGALASLSVLPEPAKAQNIRMAEVVDGLDEPWGLDFLPNGELIITEKDGRVLLWGNGALSAVQGAPKVSDRGQGGLLDVTVARDFAQTRTVWFSYSKRRQGGSGTALATAQLSQDGTRLEGLRDLFVMAPGSSGGRHFGPALSKRATEGFL